jgi:hypothetical protein
MAARGDAQQGTRLESKVAEHLGQNQAFLADHQVFVDRVKAVLKAEGLTGIFEGRHRVELRASAWRRKGDPPLSSDKLALFWGDRALEPIGGAQKWGAAAQLYSWREGDRDRRESVPFSQGTAAAFSREAEGVSQELNYLVQLRIDYVAGSRAALARGASVLEA